MALADAEQVEKEELLDALSKKEGEVEVSPEDLAELEEDGKVQPPEELDPGLVEFLEAESDQEFRPAKLSPEPGEPSDARSAGEQKGGINPEPGQERIKNVERLLHEYGEKATEAAEAKAKLVRAEELLKRLQTQAATGQLLNLAKLSQQEANVQRSWERLTPLEAQRDAMELALLKAEQGAGPSQEHSSQDQRSAKATARHADEVRRAKRAVKKYQRARQEEEALLEAISQEQARREEDARYHQQQGRRRLKEAQDRQRERKEQMEDVREARFDHDVKRVMQLKESRDAILLKIKSQNERRDKKQQKVKAEREKEKHSLLRDGKNPYEVWRREEMEAKKEVQRLRLVAQAELRSEKLMEQLIIEDKTYKRGVKEAKKKRDQKDEFQRQVGNYAKEKKISQFIRQMTIGSVDVLDPTGTALRIDPSKVSIQRTNAFGLGNARKEEIQRVEKQVRGGQRRIEKWKEENQITEQEEEAEALRLEQEQMDNFLRSASGDESDPYEEEEEVEEDGDEDEEDEEYEAKIWEPNYSKLEQQYMAAARERQRQNICSVQTWQGKEFKGDAFLAKPAIIAFQDFEVGRRYRQVIEVTNVSLTFNQFKLLPLEDSVKDFFEIEFVPPGRMSAGVTRYITLWFVPKVSQDIVSTFPILAKTGRIDFPLRCITKKTILTITPQDSEARPIINFGAVLYGESCDRELMVKNTGALSADFLLSRYEPPEGPEELAVESAADGTAADATEPLAADADGADAEATEGVEAEAEATEAEEPQADEAPETAAEPEADGEVVADGAEIADVEKEVEGAPEVGDILEMMSFQERGSCKGFGSRKIAFSFTPTRLGQFEAELLLRFFNGAPGDANYERDFRVLARGSCLDVPIFVDSDEYCMDTCVYGHIFRESVMVRNRASVAMKIQVQKPRQIEGELQLNTALAYIQGHASQSIQVKFSPKADFLERNPDFGDPERGPGAFKIPMRIVGADQVLPVNTCLTGVLTTDAVSFTPQVLNFGCCYVGSSTALRLVFLNESVLSRRFAFTRLPSYLSIQDVPSDILEEETWGDCAPGSIAVVDGGEGTFGTMLPGERRQVTVIFSPESATEMNFKISFKVLTGDLCAREFTVPCTGQGVSQVIEVSERRLDLASVPTGSSSRESIIVSNVSKVPQTINVLMPLYELCVLKATPVCCSLRPGESKRLQLEFKPTQEYVDLLKPTCEEPVEVPEGEEPPEPIDGEEYKRQQLKEIRLHGGRRWEAEATVHSSWRLPISFRPANVRESGRYQTVFLGVNTCVLPSVLSPSPAKLDFGDITAGQRHVLPLVISNLTPEDPQELHLEALPENQCFAVLNAPRTVGQRSFQFMIEFKPLLVQIYQCCLSIRTAKTRVQVPLRGKGVCPVLKIEPEDGVIHMGSVVYSKEAKDYTTNTLVVKNESPFELVYKLETVICGDRGPPPFTFNPQTATVAANSSLNVTVCFQPRRPKDIFREKVLVNVPNQREPTYVYLYGHCFNYQAYCLYGMNFTSFGRQEAETKAAFLDTLAVGTGATVNAEGGFEYPSAQIKEFSLVFERGENLKLLMIGASVAPGTPTAPQEKGLAAVTYDFQILPGEFSNLFTVEVPEGAGKPEKQAMANLQMGKPALKVAFRYNPPAENLPVFGGVSLDLLGGIGQWISVKAKGVLAGGFVPPGSAANQELTIELKAYLQQI